MRLDRRHWLPPGSCGSARRLSVQRFAGLPIKKAVCVLSSQSLFRHFSGLPLANFGDEIPPGRCVCHTGDEIISQGFSSASVNGVLRSLRGSSHDGSGLVCFFFNISCSSLGLLLAAVSRILDYGR